MLVSATRTASAWAFRALFYAVLFGVVAIAHVAITTGLRSAGWSGGASLFASGAMLLAFVLLCVQGAEFLRQQLEAWRERQRAKQKLPNGPICLVWNAGDDHADMPWEMIGKPRVRYPRLARRLGIEGVAIVDFEINAEGAAKNIHCVDAWPSDVFYEAAAAAMRHVRFQHSADAHPRFGASYRMPFLFRIAGAAKKPRKNPGSLRSEFASGAEAVEKLTGSA